MTPRCSVLLVVLFVLTLPVFVFAQQGTPKSQPAVETGSITGQVTLNGKPLAGIRLYLIEANQANLFSPRVLSVEATSDKDGKFVLQPVPPGVFTLAPSETAYVVPHEGYYGRPGKTVTVASGETVSGVEIELKRGGVISGRVTTADRTPMIGRRIVLESVQRGGRRRIIIPNLPNDTDDRGMYRIYGLPTGRYLVSLQGSAASMIEPKGARRFATVYYPGVTDESKASEVEIRDEGDEVTNIDIVVAVQSRHSVSGKIVNALTGQALGKMFYSVSEVTPSLPARPIRSESNNNGEFRLDGLTPGNYVISAVPENASSEYSDSVSFIVGETDISGLEIRVHPGSSISGSVVFEAGGATFPSAPENLSITVRQTDNLGRSTTNRAIVGADGAFKVTGLRPARAYLSVQSKGSLAVGVARIEKDGVAQPADGIELRADGIVNVRVVLTVRNSSLRGEIKLQNGTVPEGTRFRITLVSRLVTANLIAVTETDLQYRFVLTDLPAGDFDLLIDSLFPKRFGESPRAYHMKQPITVSEGANNSTIFLDLSVKQ